MPFLAKDGYMPILGKIAILTGDFNGENPTFCENRNILRYEHLSQMGPSALVLGWKGAFYCRGRAPKRVQPVNRKVRPEAAPAVPAADFNFIKMRFR